MFHCQEKCIPNPDFCHTCESKISGIESNLNRKFLFKRFFLKIFEGVYIRSLVVVLVFVYRCGNNDVSIIQGSLDVSNVRFGLVVLSFSYLNDPLPVSIQRLPYAMPS